MNDKRLFAPSTARNRGPILDVLRNVLPAKGVALEIASGAGEHVTFFAQHMPGLTFCPSDPNAEARESISAWIASTRLANVNAPARAERRGTSLADQCGGRHHLHQHDHISPWSATEALFEGGVRTLSAGAPLYRYGPYKRGGAHTAPSNAQFDASLRARNAAWGIRDLEDVAACARAKDLESLKSWTCPPISSASSFAGNENVDAH